MSDLIENYLREVEVALRVESARRRQIVAEMRAHMREKEEEMLRTEPGRPREDVQRQIIADFGNPQDLAVAYGAGGIVLLKNRAGETLLRVGRAMGEVGRAAARGSGAVLKGLAVALAVLLVVGIGVGVWAFYEVRPVVQTLVEENVPYSVYDFSCDADGCPADPSNQTFHIHDAAREVRMDLRIRGPLEAATNATVRLSVTDPEGVVRYDRTFAGGAGARTNEQVAWAPLPGGWALALAFEGDWRGSIDVEVTTLGIPRAGSG